jgi:hypothetical protein
MSNGTLQQLASKGVQDGHLTIAPETSFFKRTYKRHSNYAIEAIDVPFPSISWGNDCSVSVTRNGDLMTELWFYVEVNPVQLETPGDDTVSFTNALGHAMFSSLSIDVGGNEMDKVTGDYMEVMHELTSTVNVDQSELVLRGADALELRTWSNNGNTLDTEGNAVIHLWVKVPFWFSKARSQSVPVIALQYHDLTVKASLRSKAKLLLFSNSSSSTDDLDSTYNGEIKNGSLVINFCYLDATERRLFASNAHEYLIQNVQINDNNTKASGATKASCSFTFNHPVIALYWFVRKQAHETANDYFNFERTTDAGDDTITSATLVFNGSQREKPRGPLFFRLVVPALYYPRTPRKNIYCYSFAAFPTAWFPSGSVNFSRLDSTTLDLTFPATDADAGAFGAANVVIMATNFNIIRVQGGMGAKKFAN